MRFEDWMEPLAREIQVEDLAALIDVDELAEALTDDELGGLLDARGMLELLSEGQLSALLAVDAAQRLIRAEHEPPRGAGTRWVADQAGIAVRTARRWLGPHPPASRRAQVVDLAMSTASAESRLQLADTAPLELRISLAPEASPELRRTAATAASPELRAAVAARLRGADAQAAAVMRTRRGHVRVGRVEVVYDGRPEGTRDIGEVDISLFATSEALDSTGREDAAMAFSAAVLDAYGAGLSHVLEIADYGDGIHLT